MKVLVINYKFPPDQGVATLRVAKFAKYLSQFGCTVHVLTRLNDGRNSESHKDAQTSVESIERLDLLSDKILKAKDIRWAIPLVKRAITLIREKDIDIVLHSGPQFLPLGACMPIQKFTDVPYIVDLRDPWRLLEIPSQSGIKNRLYDTLDDFLEPRVFSCASAVVLNNQRTKNRYAEKYPSMTDKMHSIPNGYDSDDFEGIIPCESTGFNIVYPGKFRDDMRWFFEPFARLVADNSDVTFTHFGSLDRQTTRDVQAVVNQLGLESNVFFKGYVERQEVYRTTMEADLGLAVGIPNDELCIPTKIYDYMGCDIPIMGVDDGTSAMRDVLREFPNAYLIDRSDRAVVYDVLATVYRERPTGLGNQTVANKFDRCSLSRELYELMQQLTG